MLDTRQSHTISDRNVALVKGGEGVAHSFAFPAFVDMRLANALIYLFTYLLI